MTHDINLLDAAHRAYRAGATLRANRCRFKDFTYGRQWGDVDEYSGGGRSDGERAAASGRRPLTNNLIGRLVKTVVGRYITDHRDRLTEQPSDATMDMNSMDELDSRLLEEFLISGCAIQRIVPEERPAGAGIWVDNVNPCEFFIDRMKDPRTTDCELLGMLHSMSRAEVICRFGHGDSDRIARLIQIYGTETSLPAELGAGITESTDFFTASAGRCRVIEVWTLDYTDSLECHDRLTASYYEAGVDALPKLEQTNRRRAEEGVPEVTWRRTQRMKWRCRWLSPDGYVIDEHDSWMADGGHPFVLKFYPLTDGEVHPFVEDVIDQQKYVNRLITIIDNVMSTSAKGVLLFPERQLSDDYTMRDVAAQWARFDGVIKYKGLANTPEPHQVVTPTANTGAYELLALEMKLFEEVSGVTGALRGNGGSMTSAQLYEAQIRNASATLADLYAAFSNMRRQRNRRIMRLEKGG